jgi:glycosyltransferase involved in cell wall biosynthesis
MSYPLISIIIPCYNSEKYISEAIESALNQTYPNIEVIVIDDGSTDKSVEEIQKYGDKIIWETGVNRGAPAARNRGLKKSNGEFVLFLDADDMLFPDALMGEFQEIDGVDVVYGNEYYFEGTLVDSIIKIRKPYIYYNDSVLANLLRPGHHPITSSALIRASSLKDITWDINLKSGQEYYLWICIAHNGGLFKYLDKDVCKIRIHNSSTRISNQGRKKIFRNKLQVFLKIKKLLNEELEKDETLACELNNIFLTNSIHSLKLPDFALSHEFYRHVIKKLIIKYPTFTWQSKEAVFFFTNQYFAFLFYQVGVYFKRVWKRFKFK